MDADRIERIKSLAKQAATLDMRWENAMAMNTPTDLAGRQRMRVEAELLRAEMNDVARLLYFEVAGDGIKTASMARDLANHEI